MQKNKTKKKKHGDNSHGASSSRDQPQTRSLTTSSLPWLFSWDSERLSVLLPWRYESRWCLTPDQMRAESGPDLCLSLWQLECWVVKMQPTIHHTPFRQIHWITSNGPLALHELLSIPANQYDVSALWRGGAVILLAIEHKYHQAWNWIVDCIFKFWVVHYLIVPLVSEQNPLCSIADDCALWLSIGSFLWGWTLWLLRQPANVS